MAGIEMYKAIRVSLQLLISKRDSSICIKETQSKKEEEAIQSSYPSSLESFKCDVFLTSKGLASCSYKYRQLLLYDHWFVNHKSIDFEFEVLIRPSDWENYSVGKEGSKGYSVDNIPKDLSAGVYELGIAPLTKSGQEFSKLNSSYIMLSYLGQTNNVRTRLQQYGRSGAHLSNCLLTAFSRGYSIVFRWALMNDKEEAQTIEAQLLKTFDYAWNKGCNGARRPNDVFKRLSQLCLEAYNFSKIRMKLPSSHQRQVGNEIIRRHTSLDNEGISQETNILVYRIFIISRTCPQLVSHGPDSVDDLAKLCGVALYEGSICKRPLVKGTKRCKEHKGIKTSTRMQITISREIDGDCCKEIGFTYNQTENPFVVVNLTTRYSPVCGVIKDDGSSCRKQPAQGRKRCTEHKGKRIRHKVHGPQGNEN